MLRSASTRSLARAALTPAPLARRLAHGEAYHRNFVKSQSANGINTAAVGLVALFGWTGAVFYVTKRKELPAVPAEVVLASSSDDSSAPASAIPAGDSIPTDSVDPIADSAESSEANPQQAAFNPETGEINWDCPCLGGMADGPCGPEFKEAFSCFVYSNDEPKGVECVPKFRAMQTCFRKHPDIYGNDDDDEEDEELVAAAQAALAKPDDEFASSA